MKQVIPSKSLPHQQAGTAFLAERKVAALFDEQGLGKSKQLIDAIRALIETGELEGALIICPNTIKETWAQEIEKHSSLPYAIFGSGKKKRRLAFGSLKATFYVINYEAVAAELVCLKALLRYKRIALVLDESHRIKSPQASVTKAIHKLRVEAHKRIIMSGTPVANKPEDLWSQVLFLDDGQLLGETFEEFKCRFGGPERGYFNLDQLRTRLGSISLRRVKQGTIALPEKQYQRVLVSLTERQAQMYNEMRNDLLLSVRSMTGEEVIAEGENILTRLLRLAQLASNPGLIDFSYRGTPAKFEALDDLLREIMTRSATQKAIIWTSFVGNIHSLCQRYSMYKPVALFGEMHTSDRVKAIKAFKEDQSTRLFVANPAAAREGLTLTSSNVAIYPDRTFNLVDFLQSQDRIHRISQTLPCEIYILLAENTVDEFIDFSLAQKHRLASYVQQDSDDIMPEDRTLTKPYILRALLNSTA